jgi:hypothetical protein
MNRKAMLLSMTLATIPGDVRADIDGNALHRWCQAGQLTCAASVSGVADTWYFTAANVPWCVPEGEAIIYQQAADIVTAYLHNHPEKRHWPALLLVRDALVGKFPC